MLYVIIAILIFGFLIATHELGHFTAAKLLGVKVNEFSIGMGPALFKRQKGETLYSLRLLPIGGFCAMEGEDDDDSADPRAFGRAAGWKKLIILCAGAAMNFLTGLVIILCLYADAAAFRAPIVVSFSEGWNAQEQGLQLGDRIVEVDGHAIYQVGNIGFFLSRARSDRVDVVVERDGERVTLEDYQFFGVAGPDGTVSYYLGIGSGVEENDLPTLMRVTWFEAVDLVRTVWISLGDLATGAVGLRDLSGPVGIVDIMTEVGSDPQLSPTPWAAARNFADLSALIAVNLAVMNLLPLPALDGGRVFFLLLNGLLYRLFKKRIDPKYEGYVHLAGLAALMCLMLAVTLSDVGKLFGK